MTTGQRVRAIRQARGWSQLELAKRAGYLAAYVSAAEVGDASGERLWQRLADALEVPRETLACDDEVRLAAVTIRGAGERPR